MKIHDKTNIGKTGPTPNDPKLQQSGRPASDESSKTGENTTVSSLGQQIAKAKAVADPIPDIRAERVSTVRDRINSGYYDTPEAKEAIVSTLVELLQSKII